MPPAHVSGRSEFLDHGPLLGLPLAVTLAEVLRSFGGFRPPSDCRRSAGSARAARYTTQSTSPGGRRLTATWSVLAAALRSHSGSRLLSNFAVRHPTWLISRSSSVFRSLIPREERWPGEHVFKRGESVWRRSPSSVSTSVAPSAAEQTTTVTVKETVTATTIVLSEYRGSHQRNREQPESRFMTFQLQKLASRPTTRLVHYWLQWLFEEW
jgi:hypothetical protein